MNGVDNQLSIWDMLQKDAPDEQVQIVNVVNLNSRPISDYKVSLCYGELKLIVAMIEDYIKGLDVIKENDIEWNAYYRKVFKKISTSIQEQIEYDYTKAMQKCLKNGQRDSDIGEDAMALVIKRSMRNERY